MARGTSPFLLSITTTPPSSLSSPSQGLHLSASLSDFTPSAQTLICCSLPPPSFAKWHAKVSSLFSCSPTSSASPEAGEAVDHCMPFCNLSSSPSFLTQASASSWADELVQAAASSLRQQFVSLLWGSTLCMVPQTHTSDQPVLWGIPTPTWQPGNITTSPQRGCDQLRISPMDASFPRPIVLEKVIERKCLTVNLWASPRPLEAPYSPPCP